MSARGDNCVDDKTQVRYSKGIVIARVVTDVQTHPRGRDGRVVDPARHLLLLIEQPIDAVS